MSYLVKTEIYCEFFVLILDLYGDISVVVHWTVPEVQYPFRKLYSRAVSICNKVNKQWLNLFWYLDFSKSLRFLKHCAKVENTLVFIGRILILQCLDKVVFAHGIILSSLLLLFSNNALALDLNRDPCVFRNDSFPRNTLHNPLWLLNTHLIRCLYDNIFRIFHCLMFTNDKFRFKGLGNWTIVY